MTFFIEYEKSCEPCTTPTTLNGMTGWLIEHFRIIFYKYDLHKFYPVGLCHPQTLHLAILFQQKYETRIHSRMIVSGQRLLNGTNNCRVDTPLSRRYCCYCRAKQVNAPTNTYRLVHIAQQNWLIRKSRKRPQPNSVGGGSLTVTTIDFRKGVGCANRTLFSKYNCPSLNDKTINSIDTTHQQRSGISRIRGPFVCDR